MSHREYDHASSLKFLQKYQDASGMNPRDKRHYSRLTSIPEPGPFIRQEVDDLLRSAGLFDPRADLVLAHYGVISAPRASPRGFNMPAPVYDPLEVHTKAGLEMLEKWASSQKENSRRVAI
ncbi:MAG: hypothetical protein AABW73_02370 [Nanoarchaeota archaeon]